VVQEAGEPAKPVGALEFALSEDLPLAAVVSRYVKESKKRLAEPKRNI
jgi:hypothetical protein